ncbi:complex I NDUFA9 subunit family protein [Consotaella salsifontis]|uniref:NADH dehydrogenase n=1 Tax=Consotaella salsifontis TaxID=1365950 RepID=A0A1T4QX96_9HYPH|nr:complex I NDUFA9 subunit family protein [Consotaella salsifontis]SKA08081.1 NADH dehydrogenase [Consotaella salsifontis]
MAIDTGKVVTVFGGSGFLGRYVSRALAKRGHRIRVACRRPDLAYHLQTNGNMGQIQAIQANLRYPWSIERAISGADHVINLVGVLQSSGKQNFSSLHHEGAKAVAEAVRAAGISMTQMSAIGADEGSDSEYAKTKARGEAAVLAAVPDAVILRPSLLFGAEDQFFNRFAAMASRSPFLPLIGGGETKFQPVYVADVAEAVARAMEGEVAGGRIYELGGPEVMTFRELMELMLKIICRKKRFVTLSYSTASSMGRLLQSIPGAPITEDQVKQLRYDNVVSEAAKAEGRTFEAFGIEPRLMDAILPTYLVRFKPLGQFNRGGPLADAKGPPELV